MLGDFPASPIEGKLDFGNTKFPQRLVSETLLPEFPGQRHRLVESTTAQGT